MTMSGDHQEEQLSGEVAVFNEFVRTYHEGSLEEERRLRHAAYRAIDAAFSELLPGTETAEALHKYPIEFAADDGDRTVFLCRDKMPNHGTLLRIIFNDEVREPVYGGGQLYIRDFVISTVQKALTFQQSQLERQKASGWVFNPQSGPVMRMRNNKLEVVNGSDYSVHIPKTQGFPYTVSKLVEQRLLLEDLSDNLVLLNGSTAEPGYPSEMGIMS